MISTRCPTVKIGVSIPETISRSQPAISAAGRLPSHGRLSLSMDGVNDACWGKYLSFFEYIETPFSPRHPRLTGALQFFLAYLPRDSKALGNNDDDHAEETHRRRCRRHRRRRRRSRLCRCSSALLKDRRLFIVVSQRVAAAPRRKSPGTAKRSRQIGGWVTCARSALPLQELREYFFDIRRPSWPAACNEVMPAHKGFKELWRYTLPSSRT